MPAESAEVGRPQLPAGTNPVQAASTTELIVEPRGLTLADLLALLAGISIVLAGMPDDVRELFDVEVWQRDRFPDPRARALLVFRLGTWLAGGVCCAILPAVVWRQVRYRRMPYPGEWLAATLILALPLSNVKSLIHWPLERICRLLGITSPFATDDYSMAQLDNRPAVAVAVGGLVFCLAGLLLLPKVRRAPPALKTLWIALLAVVFAALVAPGGSHFIFDGIVDVPMWNRISWQEFQTIAVDVRLSEPLFLPVAVAAGFVGRGWWNGPRRRRCWTEWTGIVMLVTSISLYLLVMTHSRVDGPDGPRLLVLVGMTFGLSLPIGWSWNRWCK